MPVTLTNTLTGERWTIPDAQLAAGDNPVYLNRPPFSPGIYDVRSNSPNGICLVMDGGRQVTVPSGDATLDQPPARWSVSNHDNIYSWDQAGVDYIGLTWPAEGRGLFGWATVLVEAFGWPPVPPQPIPGP